MFIFFVISLCNNHLVATYQTPAKNATLVICCPAATSYPLFAIKSRYARRLWFCIMCVAFLHCYNNDDADANANADADISAAKYIRG